MVLIDFPACGFICEYTDLFPFLAIFFSAGLAKGECRLFVIDGQQVGLISQNVMEQLFKYPEVFCIKDAEQGKQVWNSRSSIMETLGRCGR